MKNFYDEFYNEMKRNAYFAKMELKKVEVPKNNRMGKAIAVLRPGEAIAPTIYPSDFFQEYMQGTSITRIVQNLADTMQRNSVKQYASSAEAYLSFVKKENLRAAVVNYVILSILVDTFSSRILNPMLLPSGKRNIVVF